MDLTEKDQEIISKWQDRIKRGFLWIAILRLYGQNESLSGTDIKAKINDMHRNWDPSPGSIYPILKDLEEDGLISQVSDTDKKNRYHITELGSNLLTVLRNEVFAFKMHPLEFLKRMGKNEEEFKDRFGSMMIEISSDEINEVTAYFKNILCWFEDLLKEHQK